MLIEVKVPTLAESVPDATLLDWHRQPGDAVTSGDNLIDLETDKVLGGRFASLPKLRVFKR